MVSSKTRATKFVNMKNLPASEQKSAPLNLQAGIKHLIDLTDQTDQDKGKGHTAFAIIETEEKKPGLPRPAPSPAAAAKRKSPPTKKRKLHAGKKPSTMYSDPEAHGRSIIRSFKDLHDSLDDKGYPANG